MIVRRSFFFDSILVFSVLFLLALGLVMVYSSSSIWAQKTFQNDLYFLQRHFIHIAGSAVFLFFVSQLDYHFHFRHAKKYLLVSLVLLAVVLFPGVGHTVGGATRWFRFFGFSIQPAEFTKLAFVLFLAYSLAKKKDKIRNFSVGVLPHLVIIAVIMGLLALEPDFGTSMILVAALGGMLFLGGVPIRHLALVLMGIVPFVTLMILTSPYRLVRVLTFLNPWRDPGDSGFQIIQSLVAIHSGGFFGLGLGAGRGKFFYLPAAHTDFILSVIVEELGLIGFLLALIAYLIILSRAFFIAKRAPDPFGSYLASGIGLLVGVQAALNMGVVFGLLPTKGMPLPLVSYGGSSLIVNIVAIGMLLNISSFVGPSNRKVG